MAGPGVNGVAVAMIVAGDVLVLSGLKNATLSDTLRALIKGDPVPSGASLLPSGSGGVLGGVAAGAGSGAKTGAAVAATAESYIGVPYVWAGETPSGWDCSGFVTYVLHTRHGIELPSNFHTVAAQFYVWTGAVTVARAECQAGDLVCWPGHIGIAVSNTEMVHAPGLGQKTRRQRIWSIPAPSIRRPKAYLVGG